MTLAPERPGALDRIRRLVEAGHKVIVYDTRQEAIGGGFDLDTDEGAAEYECDEDGIVEGRLQGWYKERVLLDQPYVRDEKQTVGQLLAGAELIRFAQAVVGS